MTSTDGTSPDKARPGDAQIAEARAGATSGIDARSADGSAIPVGVSERAATGRLDAALAACPGDDRIRVERRLQVLWLTIDRERQRNALALSMLDAIADAARLVADSMTGDDPLPGVRLLVIRGAGADHFAAGGDLKELDAVRTTADAERMSARGMSALQALRDCPVPVIAALNGAARGGGAELALACDLRVGHGQSAIGFVQAGLGLGPAWGGGRDLFRRAGTSRGLLHLLEAELQVGAAAVAAGLLDHLLTDSPAGFEPALETFAARLAQRPPQVQLALKALARAVAEDTPSRDLAALETRHLARTWAHPDHWALVDAAARRRGR